MANGLGERLYHELGLTRSREVPRECRKQTIQTVDPTNTPKHPDPTLVCSNSPHTHPLG